MRNHRVGLTLGLAALLPVAGARPGTAQERVDLDRFRECDACVVEPVLDMRLGDASGGGIVEGEFARVAFDEDGSRAAVYFATSIKLFDADGTFLRAMGREGGGPGEFRLIFDVDFAAGRLVILDLQQDRWTVLSDRGAVISDSRYTIGPGSFVVISPDTVVVGATDESPAGVGYPLHLVRVSDGQVLRRFGSRMGEFSAAEPYSDRVDIALGHGGRSVWVAKPNRLRFEEWSIDGALLRVAEGAPDWFPPVLEVPELGRRPPTRLREFALDRHGRLWVVTRVADPGWEKVARGAVEGHIDDTENYFDTRVDAFDLETRTHYGSFRWKSDDVSLTMRRGEVLATKLEYDEQFVPRVALYRLEVRRSTSTARQR